MKNKETVTRWRSIVGVGLALLSVFVLGILPSHEQQVSASQAAVAGGVLWGSSSTGTNASSVFKIDASMGLATLVGATGLGNRVSAISFDPLTGTLYGIRGSACSGALLITINTTTGAGTPVGLLVGSGFDGGSGGCGGGSDALAFAPDGSLYAGGWTGTGRLLKINKSTGAVLENHTTPGGVHLSGLSFSPSGVLWACHGNNFNGVLHTVDPATGIFTSSLTVRNASGDRDFATISDLAFAPDGTLYASLPNQDMLATINTSTGLLTRIGFFGAAVSNVSGLAFQPKPFDICLQDESNGNILLVNSPTGDYQFKNCRGLTVGGVATVMTKGCLLTLQVNGPDRRVLARIDTCSKTGIASIQVFSQGTTFTILDRNTTNNTCVCPGS